MRIKLMIVVGIISMACLFQTVYAKDMQVRPELSTEEADKKTAPKLTPPPPYTPTQEHIQQPPEPNVKEKDKPNKLKFEEQEQQEPEPSNRLLKN
jgi:hypothetical protein